MHRIGQTKKSYFKEELDKSHPFYKSLFTTYSCVSRLPLGLLFLSLRSIFTNCTIVCLSEMNFLVVSGSENVSNTSVECLA